MTHPHSDVLALVGLLHEGLADADVWDRALDGVCDLIGSRALFLGSVNQGKSPFRLTGHRMTPGVTDLLAGPLANPVDNPWVAGAVRQPLRRPVTVDDIGGQEQLEGTRVWREIYLAYNVAHAMGSVLERQPECADVVVASRPCGSAPFDAATIAVFGLIVPHLARAWRVKQALDDWAALAGTLSFVLDRLERAVVVTGTDGAIRFANRAADRLLSDGCGIDATRGRLRAERSGDTDALRALIHQAARTGIGGAATAVDALSLARGDDRPPLAIVAEPLAPAHGDRLGHAAEPGAILFISDSHASTSPPERRLRIVYGLTRAEARVTSLIVEGNSVGSAAAAMGVSDNTVKYHLKTIFAKVGVTRQAELVRRVLADVGGLAEPEMLRPADGEEMLLQNERAAPDGTALPGY